MNIHGLDGIINQSGQAGSPSEIIDCRDESFWENIEEGIKSTVQIIIEKGFYTVSSCQGHYTSCPIRCVSIIADIEDIRWFQLAISKINQNLSIKCPIVYSLLDKQSSFTLYDKDFLNPQIIDISFGHFMHNETLIKQKTFEQYLQTHKPYKVYKELNLRLVTPYLHNESHCDVFT